MRHSSTHPFRAIAVVAIAVTACLIFSTCKSEMRAKKMPESIGSYVYAHSSGIVSKAAPVRIRFVSPVVDQDRIGQEAESGILSFEPSVKGTATWEDTQTLRFEPTSNLTSSTTYVGKVNLKKLYGEVPQDAEVFEFDFRTRDQFFEVNVDGLFASNFNDLSKQELKGSLYTADVAAPGEVEPLLNAVQSGQDLKIDWSHSADGLQHDFYVRGIARGDKDGQMQLKWNGKSLGVDLKDERKVEVPSLSNFKITEAKVVQSEDPYVLLHFSDPLQPSQTIDGLVTIDGYEGTMRFLIDGQQLRIYTGAKMSGEHRVRVSPGLRNTADKRMQNASEWSLIFEEVKPEVRLVGRGVIMPNSNGLIFPFEAIGLTAVDIEVFKIFNNNILQFLQTNDLDESGYDLQRVGRVTLQQRVSLQRINPNARAGEWTRYALDLSKLINADPEAIYQIRIGFRPAYAIYSCSGDTEVGGEGDNLMVTDSGGDPDEEPESIMSYWYGPDGWYEDYNWEQREDPCYSAYYNSDRFVQRNVIASNLGIVAKTGTDNSYMVVVADLRTAEPISGASLEFYDYQQQLVAKAQTDAAGIAVVPNAKKPFVVIARQGKEKGYLRLGDGNSLSMSRFDVAGQVTQKGLKGFLYAERGVWRPGDSVYLNFILEDRNQRLPQNYPISFELYDPRGQLQEKRSVMRQVNQVYPLYFATPADAPTGNWSVNVKAGGASFDRIIKVETVKPNRLNIQLDFGKKELTSTDGSITGKLQSNWLHGAPASNLAAKVEVQLKPITTTFPKYGDYAFDDPARKLNDTEARTVFDGELDSDGKATFNVDLLSNNQVPGKLNANFKTRVFERSGDFSSDNMGLNYSPFDAYAGVAIPTNKYGEKRLDVNKDGKVNFVSLDTKGSPLSGHTLKVGVYKVEWRWWWDSGYDDVSRYNTSTHYDALMRKDVVTDAQGAASWNVKVEEWGRYLVRVCDTESGHCSGEYFYAGYPWYDDENNEQFREAASMLGFSADKKKYAVGETVKLTIPTGESGRVLVTLENGTKVIKSFWKPTSKGENTVTFETTPEMTPTIYAHVALIQPHAQVKNDLPIRLYGVIPINIEDPATRLAPKIAMPDVLEPEQTVTVEVSEEKGKAMAYTVDIVDEGLLGLTRYKTPNPWDVFYAREALGVRTWDVYDQVLGAYGAELERVLSIGGDAELVRGAAKDQVNRFKPVVIHLGPFYLQKGQKAKHTVKIPNYVGAVRTMVVAADKGAYGSTEKTTPVRKPLMILATLPRVLGPGEKLKLPVNVFAMEDKVKNARITVKESSGLAKIVGESSQSLQFSKPGDKLASFDIELAERTGVAKFSIVAEGAGERATQDITLEVRNANPYATEVMSKVLQPGESWQPSFKPLGMAGTNTGILEISGIPPINLGERLEYLIHYPYGCVEQTLSGGFPQLYVSKLLELNDQQKKRVPENIKATIDRLKQFQTSQGGFAYWPGQPNPDQWSTSYAGHFLLEAKALGYSVPPGMLDRWVDFQKKSSRMWDPSLREYGYYSDDSYQLLQAYRLYTLSLAGEPDMAGMNRLREQKNLTLQAKWRLAAAYAVSGKAEVAKSIVDKLSREVKPYTELAYTYGSDLRDRAMILETLVLMNDKTNAAETMKYVAEQLSARQWYSTQTVSFALLAIGKYVGGGDVNKKLQFAYQLGSGQMVNAGADRPMMQIDVPFTGGGEQKAQVKNTSNGVLYARVILRGQPVAGQEKPTSNQLQIEVAYYDMKGKALNPLTLPQGTDFVAEVKVTHPGVRAIPYRELALTQVFPSGWEIINSRMDNLAAFNAGDRPEYQDFRDDRVNTFFDLSERQTVVYRVQLNAAYQGHYYLPAVACEAMYDHSISAQTAGIWVDVGAPRDL